MLFSRKSESRHEPLPLPAPLADPAPALELPGNDYSHSYIAGLDGARTQSYIDASLTIVGDLHSAGDVRIDGRICGNVRCAQLILGRDASIAGTVIAEQAIVRGKVIGTIRSPTVVIQETAHVESEITYGTLAIDDGAFFEGTAHRRDNPRELEPAAAPREEVQQAVPPAEGTPPARARTAETEAAARGSNGKALLTNGHAAEGRPPAG
jgi:cytoskeletal protein CcmA (bactofilin family)